MSNATLLTPATPTDSTRTPAVTGWLRLARVFQKIDRRSADRFRADKLSVAQFDVLAHVGSVDGPTQQELAHSLLVTKGNVCQLIDRMERHCLLVRRQVGRANRLYLTPAGRALYERLVPRQEGEIDALFGALTHEEQVELLRLLRKLDRSLP